MWRRLRWVLLALVVALVAAAVTSVVVEKPTLDDDEQAVDAKWGPLRDALKTRYEVLGTAVTALDDAGETERAVTTALVADLAAWKKALASGNTRQQAMVANRLEGDGARLRANVAGSPRLGQIPAITGAVSGFDTAAPRPQLIDAYNRAVRTYEDDRTATARRVVALVFGFDERPLYTIPG